MTILNKLIAESTECDFKLKVEKKKPKSWLKSVSAFANGLGGSLFFGVDDEKEIVGLEDIKSDSEIISRYIRDRIMPIPTFRLLPITEEGRELLILTVSAGRSTPYYYKADGVMESLVNALIHRDYSIIGSEIHIDMYDDRLSVYSPRGMPDGTYIQNREITAVPSVRRNPVLADIFEQLGYMERKGSGFTKICSAYKGSNNKSGKKPNFFSSNTEFTVTLPNLNFKTSNEDVLNEVLNDTDKIILAYFMDNPNSTQILAIKTLPYSKRKIQGSMKLLQKTGLLKHVGSKETGSWVVNINDKKRLITSK